MKHLLLSFLILLLAFPAQPQELVPGLVGQYYRLKNKASDQPPDGKPFLVRIDKQINFREVSGDFYGSKLSDQFFVQWVGAIQIPTDGEYGFSTSSDDGSRLYIGNKLVVDNWGDHSWGKKSGKATLTAGVHSIRVAYYEGGGGAGCQVNWIPPGKGEGPIPATVLFHRPVQAQIAWDKAAWKKAKPLKQGGGKKGSGVAFSKNMGPVVSTAIRVGRDSRGANDTWRARIVNLEGEADAAMVFDTDTCRMSAGWIEPGLVLRGLPFTGGHGQFPTYEGTPLFHTRCGPGWANAKGSIADPREDDFAYPPLGPLPKSWLHYEGMYVHGDRVVFRYRVGEAKVLESPGMDGESVLCRHFNVKSDQKLTLVLLESRENAADSIQLKGMASAIREMDGQQVVDVPAGDSRFTVFYIPNGIAARCADYGPDLTPLTQGGPEQWPDTIATRGERSEETDKPYVLDRLTLPTQNPYGVKLRVGGMDFFADGTRAALCTWDGDVWIVSGIDDQLENLTWRRFAVGLHESLGLKIVDDVIYTVADDQITRFHDLNGDGEADYYENFNHDWDLTSGFHAFCFDLHTDAVGNFYFAFGSPVRGGGRSFERMGRHHGSVLKVSPDGKTLTTYASGLRAPNGIGVSPSGQVTSGDNEGTFVPRSPINWIAENGFHGVVDSYVQRDELKTTPTVAQYRGDRPQHLEPSEMPAPLAWLPKQIDNSGGGQVWVTSDRWGPLNGELLHMSYGRSALYQVLKEEVDGQVQGGVWKFPLRFTSSCMRARFNPKDGQLYVVGLKGWQTNAGKEGGFDRVRYTGVSVAIPNRLEMKADGFVIGFTTPLDKELAEDPESFAVKACNIRWTHGYGSGEYEIGDDSKGWTSMPVTGAKLLADGRSIRVKVEGMQPVHMMEISVDLETKDGEEIFGRINNTVHRLGGS